MRPRFQTLVGLLSVIAVIAIQTLALGASGSVDSSKGGASSHTQIHIHGGAAHAHRHSHDCAGPTRGALAGVEEILGPTQDAHEGHHCCEEHLPTRSAVLCDSDRKREDRGGSVCMSSEIAALGPTVASLTHRSVRPLAPGGCAQIAHLRTVVLQT